MRSDVLKELERHLAHAQRVPARRASTRRGCETIIANLGTPARGPDGRPARRLAAAAARLRIPGSIKQRSAIPGGTCEFDLPDYFFWLNQPAESPHRGLRAMAGTAAAAVRCHRRAAVADAPERPQRARNSPRAACSTSTSTAMRRPSCCASPAAPSRAVSRRSAAASYRCNVRFLKWNGLEQRAHARPKTDVPFTLIMLRLSGRSRPCQPR